MSRGNMRRDIQIIAPAPLASMGARLGFSPAVVVNGVAHISGQVGVDPSTGQIPQTVEAQLENLFGSLELVLSEAGTTFQGVFSLTSYHVGDMQAQMAAFIAAKVRRMGPRFPAWTSVGVTALAAPGLLVEVSALALI